ncbi:NUDIX hydrolase [Streptomyces sp. NBC_01244]|uniref:NUDIX hydrolase n=1 Tax=Streptomyces sp. NBC_01244 TaxID=2903797 RepID=UPI002E124545|nr:NUDIX hydrolase [Streptomyces sp. NBC_01244]
MADESERPVAAAVVVHKGRLLLVRRRIAEGQLSWQFPAGKVEPEESREAAAVREAQEETGLQVIARELLGERVHPATGRLVSYTACDVLSGTAHVAAEREVAEIAWVTRGQISAYVPHGLFGPVEAYLDGVLG